MNRTQRRAGVPERYAQVVRHGGSKERVLAELNRLKLMNVPYDLLKAMFQVDERSQIMIDGWPVGAEIIGSMPAKDNKSVAFILYHPDWEPTPQPEFIQYVARGRSEARVGAQDDETV